MQNLCPHSKPVKYCTTQACQPFMAWKQDTEQHIKSSSAFGQIVLRMHDSYRTDIGGGGRKWRHNMDRTVPIDAWYKETLVWVLPLGVQIRHHHHPTNVSLFFFWVTFLHFIPSYFSDTCLPRTLQCCSHTCLFSIDNNMQDIGFLMDMSPVTMLSLMVQRPDRDTKDATALTKVVGFHTAMVIWEAFETMHQQWKINKNMLRVVPTDNARKITWPRQRKIVCFSMP